MIKLNDHEIVPTIFPDGTSQVWNIPGSAFAQGNIVEWAFESEAEFMHLAQLKLLLDHMMYKADLSLPYLPYGRQDKRVKNSETFALRSFTRLLNTLEFDRVTVFDPHSDVATIGPDKIKNVVVLSPRVAINRTISACSPTRICYPDAGAFKRYNDMATRVPGIVVTKERNQQTGHVTIVDISGDVAGQDILIIDDICDGGMTFILTARELLNRGARNVFLYVSHGIFSKGVEVLLDAGINRIFTKSGEIS